MTNTSNSSINSSKPLWHSMGRSFALRTLETSQMGLSSQEAEARLQSFGPNVIEQKMIDGPLTILWRQVNNPLIWVLIASSAVAVTLGKVTDGAVVAAVVVLNSIIGFFQEFKAGKAIEALVALVPENASVLRDKRKIVIPASQVVPGDIVFLSSGDKVPADLRFIQVRNLQIEEAALTGESLPVQKQVEKVDEKAGLGDRLNMAYSSTMVTYGTGTGVVVATANDTEIGRISKMMHETTSFQTPLTKSLTQIAQNLTIWIVGVTIVLFLISLWRGFPFTDALLVGVTLAVAAIPEGLPAVVTIALAIGVRRMARRQAVIRKLPAVETLGSTSVICTDKTGTLTKSEMTVQVIWVPSGSYELSGVGYEPKGKLLQNGHTLGEIPEDVNALLTSAMICNDSGLSYEESTWVVHGDPTEAALIVAGEKLGLSSDDCRDANRRIDTIPFESEHKFMATLNQDKDENKTAYIKGAPEILLKRCQKLGNDTPINVKEIMQHVDNLASRGMRVLAVAKKKMAHSREELLHHDVESGFVLLGLIGMIDPPRSEAVEAVENCHRAGITVKMITGDHKGTAHAIAKEIGLLDGSGVLTGNDIDNMSDEEFSEAISHCNVFARVAPEHKLRLVCALQNKKHVVAMTGDGVNDAPALKQANIGVAMGITGTAVSKEAADMVLADDNFSTIAAAVEEGRRVYDNLIKSLVFLLPTNLGLAFILMFGVIFLPNQEVNGQMRPLLPMLPTQILWINLVAAVALALPLGFEAKEPNIMLRPPRSSDEPLMNRFVVLRTVLVALLMAACSIGIFYVSFTSSAISGSTLLDSSSYEKALRIAQTEAVTCVIMFQIFYLFGCRSLRYSVFKIGFFSNPSIFLGIGIVLALHLAYVYLGFMQKIFNSVSLDLSEFGISIITAIGIVPLIALEKWLRERYSKKS
ncbi:MAG: HAD-IC family P-type ATPase [SAR324 cluster bacterium]|uniref:HAD-IC family P-type ATPase n=1 Tax=SAR324 cluster bacterium TaxID=2024889 RepID=A0A7X9IKF5_9DELT|nr:HAD-IC family P-type ATPase [SAR324 cluster bacterium]